MSRLAQGVLGVRDGRFSIGWGLLTNEVDTHPLLSAQEGYHDARVFGAEQMWRDLVGGQTQDRFSIDLKQNIALLDHS